MPPRLSIRSNPNTRPLSAIYIGNQSNGDHGTNNSSYTSSGSIIATLTTSSILPDLPEPPSPVSSTGSGLPSPPATNSTGSGSTGDPASIALRRQAQPTMSHIQSTSSRSSSRLSFQVDDDGELDEDQTMRIKVGPSPESALQRARNLVERNKIQLDKMASGRLSSASSSSSSRLNHRYSMPDAAQALSGSETEREGDAPIVHSTTSTTSSGTKSSTQTGRIRLSSAPNSPHRLRKDSPTRRRKRMSLASTRSQGISDDEDDTKDNQRYDVGTAQDRIRDRQSSTLRDSPRTPVVNLNSPRKSPTAGTKRRSALPREFREGSADQQHPNPSNSDPPPHTPYRQTSSSASMSTLGRRSTLRTQRGLSDDLRNSPSYSASTSSLRSRVRTPNNNTNTATPPSSATSTKLTHTFDDSPTLMRSSTIGRQHTPGSGRRQQLRGGSAESALGSGRSLVGEGLRAAGLGIRKERERTINESEAVTGKAGQNDVFGRDGQRRVDWSPESTESLARQQRRSLVPEPQRASTSMADYSYTSRSRHPDMSDDETDGEERVERVLRTRKSAFPVLASREASLSRKEQTLAERERELARRERELERERAGSVLERHHIPSPFSTATTRDRYSSPYGTMKRKHAVPASSSQVQNTGQSSSQSEHARLMVDSLTMFESQINKLAPLLNHTGQSGNHTEMLMRNAQTLVVSADKLNTMMRSGNAKALDAQIEAEVDGDLIPHIGGGSNSQQQSLVEVWRKIGGDYREGVRVSDELVRALTGLLLGVGRVMKDYSSSHNTGGSATGSEAGSVGTWSNHGGSPQVHARSISLNDDDMRLRGSMSPESCQTGSGKGDRSERGSVIRESRRSWEPSEGKSSASSASASTGTGSREEALRRLAGVRSDSPLARASPAFQAVRELDRLETASPAFGIAAGVGATGAASNATSTSALGLPRVNIPGVRRLFAPSQQREMALVQQAVASSTSGVLGEMMESDPSPTPVSRTRVFDRAELGVPVTSSHLQHRSPLQQQIPLEEGGRVGVDEENVDKMSPVSQPRSTSKVLETPLRRAVTISGSSGTGSSVMSRNRQGHERRKISATSIATIRAATTNTVASTSTSTSTPSSAGISSGGPPVFSSLTTPSGATTAVTLDGIGVGMVRMRSDGSGTGSTSTTSAGTGTGYSGNSATGSGGGSPHLNVKPTFSRPEGMSSVSGLQQQLEDYRRRKGSEGLVVVTDGSGGQGNENQGRGKGRISATTGSSLITPESERENRRKTIGARAGVRMSLDSQRLDDDGLGLGTGNGKHGVVDLTVNAADRSAAATISAAGAAGMMRKERRRVVTDIWRG